MLWSFAIAAFAQEPPPVDPAPVPGKGGWVVLVGAAQPDEGKALLALAGLFDKGVPRHAEYPIVVPMAPYDRAGFGIAVAVPDDQAVAERIARALTDRGLFVEVLPAKDLPVEDLHVIAIDAVHVTGNGAPLYPYDLCLGKSGDKDCWATGTLDDDLRLVLPFLAVPAGTVPGLTVTAGEPWRCPQEPLGLVHNETPVWLKSPVKVDCFEDSTPTKRKAPR